MSKNILVVELKSRFLANNRSKPLRIQSLFNQLAFIIATKSIVGDGTAGGIGDNPFEAVLIRGILRSEEHPHHISIDESQREFQSLPKRLKKGKFEWMSILNAVGENAHESGRQTLPLDQPWYNRGLVRISKRLKYIVNTITNLFKTSLDSLESISLGGAGRSIDDHNERYCLDQFNLIRTLPGAKCQVRHSDEGEQMTKDSVRRTRSFSVWAPVDGDRTITFFPRDVDSTSGVKLKASSGDLLLFSVWALHCGDAYSEEANGDALHWYELCDA